MSVTFQYGTGIRCNNHSKAWLTLGLLSLLMQRAGADPITLGDAADFGVLGSSTVTNTGGSVISGDVGVSAGSAITGFPPGKIVGGSQQSNTALAIQAQSDLATAMGVISAEAPTQNLSGTDLGGLTLDPGVYLFSSSAQLTGPLDLDALGNPNARFDFEIGSTLKTASLSTVTLTGGAVGNNVYWNVGSSATLGTGTQFEGNILADVSITATTGASDPCGKLLAHTGAVTLDTNTIGACTETSSVTGTPEPGLGAYLGCFGFATILRIARKRRKLG